MDNNKKENELKSSKPFKIYITNNRELAVQARDRRLLRGLKDKFGLSYETLATNDSTQDNKKYAIYIPQDTLEQLSSELLKTIGEQGEIIERDLKKQQALFKLLTPAPSMEIKTKQELNQKTDNRIYERFKAIFADNNPHVCQKGEQPQIKQGKNQPEEESKEALNTLSSWPEKKSINFQYHDKADKISVGMTKSKNKYIKYGDEFQVIYNTKDDTIKVLEKGKDGWQTIDSDKKISKICNLVESVIPNKEIKLYCCPEFEKMAMSYIAAYRDYQEGNSNVGSEYFGNDLRRALEQLFSKKYKDRTPENLAKELFLTKDYVIYPESLTPKETETAKIDWQIKRLITPIFTNVKFMGNGSACYQKDVILQKPVEDMTMVATSGVLMSLENQPASMYNDKGKIVPEVYIKEYTQNYKNSIRAVFQTAKEALAKLNPNDSKKKVGVFISPCGGGLWLENLSLETYANIVYKAQLELFKEYFPNDADREKVDVFFACNRAPKHLDSIKHITNYDFVNILNQDKYGAKIGTWNSDALSVIGNGHCGGFDPSGECAIIASDLIPSLYGNISTYNSFEDFCANYNDPLKYNIAPYQKEAKFKNSIEWLEVKKCISKQDNKLAKGPQWQGITKDYYSLDRYGRAQFKEPAVSNAITVNMPHEELSKKKQKASTQKEIVIKPAKTNLDTAVKKEESKGYYK